MNKEQAVGLLKWIDGEVLKPTSINMDDGKTYTVEQIKAIAEGPKCKGFKLVPRGWRPERLSGGRRGHEKLRRAYRKVACQNDATHDGFCRHHTEAK